jgi:hypothetical protein
MMKEIDRAVRNATRFVWVAVTVYAVSGLIWIFMQVHMGRSIISTLFSPMFVLATGSVVILVFG